MIVAMSGLGRWGRNIYTNLSKNKEVKIKRIVCLKTDSYLNIINENKQDDIIFSEDFKDIVEDKEVESVVICSPPNLHYSQAKQALLAGKNVLVEKPLCFYPDQAQELLKLAKEKNLILMVGHIHYFNEYLKQVSRDIMEGKFGNIECVMTNFHSNLKRYDVDILWDVMPHDFSLFLLLLGEENGDPIGIYPNISSNNNVAVTNMIFKNNVFGSTTITWKSPLKRREVQIIGERMMAHFDDYKEDPKLTYYSLDGLKIRDFTFDNHNPLRKELDHFIFCSRNKMQPPTDGINGFKVIRSIYNTVMKIRGMRNVK